MTGIPRITKLRRPAADLLIRLLAIAAIAVVILVLLPELANAAP